MKSLIAFIPLYIVISIFFLTPQNIAQPIGAQTCDAAVAIDGYMTDVDTGGPAVGVNMEIRSWDMVGNVYEDDTDSNGYFRRGVQPDEYGVRGDDPDWDCEATYASSGSIQSSGSVRVTTCTQDVRINFDCEYNPLTSPPGAFTVTANPGLCGTNENRIYWTTATGATSYTLHRGTTSTFTPSSFNDLETRATPRTSASPYVDPGLTPGTTYWYKVVATNAGGNTTASDSADAPNACAPPPVNCTFNISGSVIDEDSDVGINAATVSITAIGDPNRSATTNASGNFSTSFVHACVTGTNYLYSVSAQKAGCTSSSGNVVLNSGNGYSDSITLGLDCGSPPPPTPPTGLSASPGACGSGTINLTWNPVAGATSYTLVRDGSPLNVGNVTSYSHTGLAASSNHTYTVRVTTAAGTSAGSGPVTVSAPAACPPPPPGCASPIVNTINVTQDASIRGGSLEGNNYGSLSSIYLGSNTTVLFDGIYEGWGWGFLKYNIPTLSSLGGSRVISAVLQLNQTSLGPVPTSLVAFPSSSGWSENTITGNNAPGIGGEMGGVPSYSSLTPTIDVTDYIRSNLGNTTTIVMGLSPLTTTLSTTLASREANASNNRLIITTCDDGGVISGRVYNAATSAGLDQATVNLYRVGAGGVLTLIGSQPTPADGTYSFTGLATASTYRLELVDKGPGRSTWTIVEPAAGVNFWNSISTGSTRNFGLQPPAVPPPPPTGLDTQPGTCGTGTITISWNSVAGATNYTLEVDGVAVNKGLSLNHSHTGLSANSSHTYRVRVTTAAGTSVYSNPVSEDAPGPCAPPAPTGLTATAGVCDSDTIDLTWNTVAGAISYQLFRNNSQIYSGAGNDYADINRVPGITYVYKVRATTAAGQSVDSTEVSEEAPLSCAQPPTGLAAVPDAACGTGIINVSWNAVPGAISYAIIRDGGAPLNVGNVTSYAHTGLVAGSSHNYRVTVTTAAGTSNPSNIVFANAPAACPPPGTDITVSGTILVDNNANGVCTDAADTPFTGGAVLSLFEPSGTLLLPTVSSDSVDGTYSFIRVTDESGSGFSLSIGNISGYNILTPGYNAGTGFSFAMVPPLTRTFNICIGNSVPWFQTDYGDVRMPSIYNPVPDTETAAEFPAITNKLPVFYSTLGSGDFGTDSPTYRVNNEYNYNTASTAKRGTTSYTYYNSLIDSNGITPKTLPSFGCNSASSCNFDPNNSDFGGEAGVIVKVGNFPDSITNLTLTGFDLPIPGAGDPVRQRVVILVSGNLTINENIVLDDGDMVIFAVKGNINVDPSVTQLDGIFTSEGSINIPPRADLNCGTGVADVPLLVNGNLVANSLFPFANNGSGTISVGNSGRNLCSDNAANPALKVKMRYDFITSLTNFYRISQQTWREVQP